MRRGHLTNGQWERLEPLLPAGEKPGHDLEADLRAVAGRGRYEGQQASGLLILPDTPSFHGIPTTLAMVTAKIEPGGTPMPYETGAKVKLTRDVQVTANDTAARIGCPGPLCLAEGLEGIVTGSAKEAGGAAQDGLAEFERRIRGVQFDGFTAGVLDNLRQQIIQHGGIDAGVGAQIRYRVRFENGFVLGGLEEGWLTEA
ncbi:transposase [Streptomyces sp. NPDC048337]|uniref:transposase n=1 Tax=Streptomyces sp. NPDC048337 TaxID=3365535 RepID=UPI00371E802E